MNKRRSLNLLSLIANLSVVYFTAWSVIYNFRSDVYRPDRLTVGWGSLRYFTVLSNVFAAIACAITFYFNVKNILRDEYKFPLWSVKLKYTATVSVTVTFLTVVFFLAPYSAILGSGYFTLFRYNNFYLHFLSPVLVILSFILSERAGELKFPLSFLGLAPTAIYSVLYTTMVLIGEERGGWPDFYGFTFGGDMIAAALSLIMMYIASFLIAIAVWIIRKKVCERE
ncbi:MAG: hypothetical protein J6126_00910 [Clostridia bacterium]|nr:hypothetical protein [Clostridia bacterium]